VETLKGHSGTVFCMWADGGHVVSGDSNDWLFVWDLRQRRRLQSFKEHEGVVPTHPPTPCRVDAEASLARVGSHFAPALSIICQVAFGLSRTTRTKSSRRRGTR
jgi:hypothetical protein